MPIASEIQPIGPGLSIWRLYDPTVKAELFSTGIETWDGVYVIDPVGLTSEAMADLTVRSQIAGIIVTNENHERAAGSFAKDFRIPIHLHPVLVRSTTLPGGLPIQDGGIFATGLTAITIDGGPAGEIAVHSRANGGTLIVGDALINFEPFGFAFLPAKYCSNVKMMRRSLPKLLDYPFERMLFAHGTPLLSGARQRFEELLQAS